MGKGHFNLPWANEGAKMASFIFGYAISEFEKRGGKIFNGNINLDISLVMQNWMISLMACLVLNMCELMKGALHCEFFHIYIICMCGLRNPLITLRWDAIMASRLLELWRCKKGKNGTQFVFCRCIIRFFSQLCKKNLRLI